MGNLLVWSLEAGFSLTVFYMIFKVLLSKDTFFSLNRFYLLFTALLSLMIPVFNFQLHPFQDTGTYSFVYDTITVSNNAEKVVTQSIDAFKILGILYLAGVILFSSRFIFMLIQILLIKKQGRLLKYNGRSLVITNENISPFSFFGLIFITEIILNDEAIEKIIAHENAHIGQYHTLDLIFSEFVTIFLWYNPFAWLHKRELKSMHEYLADKCVLGLGSIVSDYQTILLQQVYPSRTLELTNNFSKSILKGRIEMMRKSNSSTTAILKYGVLLPVLAALVLLLSVSINRQVSLAKDNLTQNLALLQSDVKTYTVGGGKTETKKETVKKSKKADKKEVSDANIKEMPKCDLTLLAKSVKYPEAAKKSGKEGKVLVKALVNKDGKISKTEIAESDDKVFNNAAMKAVKSTAFSPALDKDGKAVKAWVTIPIKFKLAPK
ncbi:MAG: M56 family metallopeptidase [Bacteroidota bacterium]